MVFSHFQWLSRLVKAPRQGVCATVVVPGPLAASTTMAMSYDCPKDQDVKGPGSWRKLQKTMQNDAIWDVFGRFRMFDDVSVFFIVIAVLFLVEG